jgi:hypothetical protein
LTFKLDSMNVFGKKHGQIAVANKKLVKVNIEPQDE